MTFLKKDAINLEKSRLKKSRADLQQQSLELENELRQCVEEGKKPKLRLALGEEMPERESPSHSIPLKIQKRKARNRFLALCVVVVILLIIISRVVF